MFCGVHDLIGNLHEILDRYAFNTIDALSSKYHKVIKMIGPFRVSVQFIFLLHVHTSDTRYRTGCYTSSIP